MSWIRQYCEERNEAEEAGYQPWHQHSPPSLTRPAACRWSARGRGIDPWRLSRLRSISPAPSRFSVSLRRRAQHPDRRPHAGCPALRDQGALNDWLNAVEEHNPARSRMVAEAGLAGVIKRVSAGAKLLATKAGSAVLIRKTGLVGFLPKEVDVLREFAQQGYYT